MGLFDRFFLRGAVKNNRPCMIIQSSMKKHSHKNIKLNTRVLFLKQ